MRPHTPEWFTTTDRSNPDLADAARRNIKHAGHADVCTICGDAPEGDFQFMSGSLILRLCPGCKMICSESYEAVGGNRFRR
jgi:hypothetical protein